MKLLGPFTQILTMRNLPLGGPISSKQMEILADQSLLIDGEVIQKIAPFDELFRHAKTIHEIQEPCVLLPGLIDSHTHLCYAGTRSLDFSLRLEGKSYQEIAQQGGGIVSTVEATRRTSLQELRSLLSERITKQLSLGITTSEVKSGYGLSIEDECKMLQAIQLVNKENRATLIPTCLAAHVRAPEFSNNRAYLSFIEEQLFPLLIERKLSSRIDIFVDEHAFSCREALPYLQRAKQLGFTLCLHANQFSTGGAQLAAEVQAISADHLEIASDIELTLLQEKGVIPIVLPGASLGLGIPFAPARRILDHMLPLVIASDANPGSAPMENLLTGATLLAIYEKLTEAEVFAAITCRAARALGCLKKGCIDEGYAADLVAFPTADYRDILYRQGEMRPCLTIAKGVAAS